MSDDEPIEGPAELSARYWRELGELLDQGEIDAAFAQRIVDDLFEPIEPGRPAMLKWSAWRAYVDEQQDLSAICALRKL